MQPTSPQRDAPGTHSNAGTLVTNNHRTQPAVNAQLGILDKFTTELSLIFRKLLPEQPSLLVLSDDALHHIFTHLTDDKDLCSFTLTCVTLCTMETSPQIQFRVQRFKFDRQLDMKGTELLLAIDKRPLSSSETLASGIHQPIMYRNCAQLQADAEHTLAAEQSEKGFYTLFMARCTFFNISTNSNEFLISRDTVINTLSKKVGNLNLNSRHMTVKLQTASQSVNGRIFHGICEAFANQPVSTITPDAFKQKVAELKALLPLNNLASIEAALRGAMRSLDNIVRRGELANAYLDPAPNNPKIEELKQALRIELEASKTAPGITEEKLYEIETKLANLEVTAKMEAQKLGLFNIELNKQVPPGKEAACSAALHRIID